MYRAVVLNVTTNIHNKTLSNAAQIQWTGNTNSVTAATTTITVIEPKILTAKTATVQGSAAPPANGDAGDAVIYTIKLSHDQTNAPISDTDAYDVSFSDTIPAKVTVIGFTVADTASLVSAGNFNLTGNNLTTTTTFDMPFSTTRVITITVTGSFTNTVNPAEVITNTANTTWTSLTGTPAQISAFNAASLERDGSGGVNTYKSTGTNAITIFVPAPVKSIVATSQAHTTMVPATTGFEQVAIGEIVRYHLAVRIPEGTSPSVVLRDNVPTGMMFLNDGTIKIAFVATANNITSTKPAAATLALGLGTSPFIAGNSASVTPTVTLPGVNIGSSNSLTADVDTYTNGAAVFFKLGDIVNSESDADTEFVVIEYNALVLNTTANQSGVFLNNTFGVFNNGTQVGVDSVVDNTNQVQVAEPVIVTSKTTPTTNADGGDTITYTIDISNTATGNSRADGFQIVAKDTLDANFQFQSLVLVSPAGVTASFTAPAVGSAGLITINADTLRPVVDYGVATSKITATVVVKVIDAVKTGSVINNKVDITYVSIPPSIGRDQSDRLCLDFARQRQQHRLRRAYGHRWRRRLE